MSVGSYQQSNLQQPYEGWAQKGRHVADVRSWDVTPISTYKERVTPGGEPVSKHSSRASRVEKDKEKGRTAKLYTFDTTKPVKQQQFLPSKNGSHSAVIAR